jgi:predicted ATP-dependent protease
MEMLVKSVSLNPINSYKFNYFLLGGVNSKIIASKSLNINVIILPFLNLEEVLELPKKLLDGINLYFVKEYKEIFKLVFENDQSGVCVIKNGILKMNGEDNSSINNQASFN